MVYLYLFLLNPFLWRSCVEGVDVQGHEHNQISIKFEIQVKRPIGIVTIASSEEFR